MKLIRYYADFTNFSFHGGAEKNGEALCFYLEKTFECNVIRIHNNADLFRVALTSLFKKEESVLFTFKGSALSSLLLQTCGVIVVNRVNNSPEAYLYWGGWRSLVSYTLRIRSIRKNITLFNSQKVKEFYSSKLNENNHLIYLPNKIEKQDDIRFTENNKLFVSARLSSEKQALNTYNMLSELGNNIIMPIHIFSSSPSSNRLVKSFSELEVCFDDVYVSMSLFEGMPNMAIEVLLSGGKLILSNCWAHTELMEILTNFGLGDRIMLRGSLSSADIPSINNFCEKTDEDTIDDVLCRIHSFMEHYQQAYRFGTENLWRLLNERSNSTRL